MILLKNLLNEIDFFQNLTQQFDTSVANTSKLNILAIGDNEVQSNYSFAKQLKRHLDVNITTAGYRNVNANAILKILNRRLDSKFQIVIIMVSGNNDGDRSPNNAIQQLAASFTLAKKYGARVIAITNPTKQYLTPKNKLYKSDMYPTSKQIATWVNSQSITDETIDTYNLSNASFNRDNLTLTARAHKNIMGQVKTIINMFNFNPKEIAPIEDTDTGLGKSKNLPKTKTTSEYVAKWAPLAISQMKKHGIPASITLAQGIIESGNGTSALTVQAFNHFGIKGSYEGKTWCGDTTEFRDGAIGNEQACFKSYPNDEASFEDHSNLLLKSRYTAKTKGLSITDYVGWANALKSAGYATAPTYAQTLIDTIEKLGLNEYDVDNGLNLVKDKLAIINTKLGGETKGKQYFPSASKRSFGMQTLQGTTRMHYGQDYPASTGIKVLVLKPGKCIISKYSDSAGNYVKIKHDDNTVTTYMHFSELLVNKGDRIESGTVIGLIGSTGHSTGPHLHFEYRPNINSEPENPKAYGPEYFILQRT